MTNKELMESMRVVLDFIFGEDGYVLVVFGIFIAIVNTVLIISYIRYKVKVLKLRNRRRSQTSDDK